MRRCTWASLIVIGSLLASEVSPAHAQTRDGNSPSTPVGEYDARPQTPNDAAVDEYGEQNPRRAREPASLPMTRRQPRPISDPPPTSGTSQAKTEGAKSGVGSASTTMGALAIVIAVILVGGWVLKRHNPLAVGGLPAEAVELLGRRQVDPKQAIHLVRLGSRLLVLGSSAQGLCPLAEVTDPVEVDYLAGLCRQRSSESTASQTFRTLFNMRAATSRGGNRTRHRTSTPAERPAWDTDHGAAEEAPEVRHV